ncbi:MULTISPECIES: Fic family protein [unclassified Brevundimonas]|uniref:Fic family protein n=1 Tax=unclassified Brevundimonas TaxID=2622653 RepID=UPI003F8FFFF5
MATPQEKLANALEALHGFQKAGRQAIRSDALREKDRALLVRSGFLQPVIKGWYIATRPDASVGESTAWYASYWDFVRDYLTERFGEAWSLSPEQSLLLHAGQWTVPRQLLVRSPQGRGHPTSFLHDTSIYDLRVAPAEGRDQDVLNGLRVYRAEAALVAAAPSAFVNSPTELRTVLSMQRDASGVLERLLEGGRSAVAGRLAGAFRNIGRTREADDILSAMKAAGYDVREHDPFEARLEPVGPRRETSPHVQRIRMMWETMRRDIPAAFPISPGPVDTARIAAYLDHVDDLYETDAYHSLSIEGYRVSAALIQRVRSGEWNPDIDAADRVHRDALAARGYWQAFQAVKTSLERVLKGDNPGDVADHDHGTWYRELFTPSVTAGLVGAASLAGYRSDPVFIRRSRHTPMNADAVRDVMPVLFELLAAEPDPAVRVVLGHFIFVYVHPYIDGNGRTGRFLMNLMLAAGGYPWTVIPVQERDRYMAALEEASANQNIVPFAEFLGDMVGRDAPAADRPTGRTEGRPPAFRSGT